MTNINPSAAGAVASLVEQASYEANRAGAIQSGIVELDVLVDGQRSTIEGQAAEIARLRDLLDNEPPPPAGRFLVGASCDRRGGESAEQAVDRWEAETGALVAVARVFIPQAPTASNVMAAMRPHVGKRHVAISAKGEWSNASLAAIADDGFTHWVIPHHEPDNDIKQGMPDHTPEWFKGITARHGALLSGHARYHLNGGDLVPALCVTSWLERDSEPGTTSADWFPDGPLDGWCLGMDPYDEGGKASMQALVVDLVRLWRARGGSLLAVMETNTNRTGAAGQAWMVESVAYLKREAFSFVCLWAGRAPYNDTDADMLRTWGALAAENGI